MIDDDDDDESEIRILCVDDEPKILEGLELTLGMDYDVTTAPGGAEALELIESEGPFAITISDMRMPGMDGATYLSKVADTAPDTVRILLTGFSETEAAIRAINHGRIFRFLSKPCEAEVLIQTVQDAWKQHRLLTAEKELLQETLYSCIKVLTELLSMANPVAFNHGCHMIQLLADVGDTLAIKEIWEVELAVMLIHLGYVGMTPALLERSYTGAKLSKEEQKLVTGAPGMAHSLLKGIPRMEVVLGMVLEVGEPPVVPTEKAGISDESRIAWGAHVIQALEQAGRLFSVKGSADEVAAALKAEGNYHKRVVKAIHAAEFPEALGPVTQQAEKKKKKSIVKKEASQLKIGMVLSENAVSPGGVLFVKAGQEITGTVVKLLRRMSDRENLVEPLLVLESS